MDASPLKRSRGRQPGWRKAWRTDPDRFVIAMASAIFWGPVEVPVETTIRLAVLLHGYGHKAIASHQQVLRRQRRLNLSDAQRRDLAEGWHHDIWEERAEDKPTKDGPLANDTKRLVRKAKRLMTDSDFQAWHEQITFAWHAILWSDYKSSADPGGIIARALKMRVEICSRTTGEIDYLTKVLLPFLKMVVDAS